MARDTEADLSDEELLLAFGSGEPKAARLLTLRLAPRILRFSTRMLGNVAEAEEVTQEVMLRLWKIAPVWQQEKAKVSTWAFKVASNLCVDRFRKQGEPTKTLPEDLADDQISVDEKMTKDQRQNALYRALDQLVPNQRQAIFLRHIEGCSNPKIAEIMGISVEAVESLSARAKRKLVALLSEEKEALGFKDG